MEEDLAALSTQLERNFSIMRWWASLWYYLILRFEEIENEAIIKQIRTLDDELNHEEALLEELFVEEGLPKQILENEEKLSGLDEQLLALQAQLSDLISEQGDQLSTANSSGDEGLVTAEDAVQQAIRDQIDQTHAQRVEIEKWLQQNDLEAVRSDGETRLARIQTEMADLEKQHERWLVREAGRRLVLSAGFMLVVLQSYVLPVLYGLLGASVFVLRSIMRSISDATYYPDRSYLLRLALGTLSGLIIGWFVFLLPGQSFLSSLSPMALAFIVGYNIEIIFSLMDKVIDNFTSARRKEDDAQEKKKSKPESGKPGSGDDQTNSHSTETKPA
jgi:hypothetical protein